MILHNKDSVDLARGIVAAIRDLSRSIETEVDRLGLWEVGRLDLLEEFC